MKNIDIIIKFLSGEMSPDEKIQFQKSISGDPELEQEYESVKTIWEEIRNQLKLVDGPDSMDREQLLAEIIAEYDIRSYDRESSSSKEDGFRKILNESIVNHNETGAEIKSSRIRVIPIVGIMAAAMMAALIIIIKPFPDLNELTAQYYQPEKDPVFESMNNISRSGLASALALFNQGNFKAARSAAFDEMKKYPDAAELYLMYALACYEEGDTQEAELILAQIVMDFDSGIDETAIWYMALIDLKEKNMDEARKNLATLKINNGAYSKQAKKLLRKMD